MVARLARLLVVLVAVLGTALPAWAQRAQLQLEPPELQVGQTGRMTLYVVEERPSRTPQLDAGENVRIEFDGSYQRFHTNGFDRVMVYFYRYRVTPLVEGTHTLGSWDIDLRGGKTVATGPVFLEARPREADALEALSVTAGFDVEEAWEGQVVVYDYELVASVPVMGVEWRLPKFDGLRPTTTGTAQQREYYIDDPDGGQITVTGGSLPFVISGFGNRDQTGALAQVRVPVGGSTGVFGLRQYTSKPATSGASPLSARALPPAPENFSGLVGDFEFRSSVPRRKAVVGESVEWVIDVAGSGSLDGWSPPDLPEMDGFTVYDSDGTVDAAVADGKYQARARFPRVIVPSQPGSLNVPPLELVTFSTSEGRYVTHKLAVGRIEVVGGAEAGGDIESFAGEIPEVADESGIAFRGNYTWGMASTPRLYRVLPLLSVGLALPAFGLLLVAGLRGTRDVLAERFKTEERPPTARERLAALPDEPEARLAALDAALRQALAEREGVDLESLDREAAVDALPDELAARVREIQRTLDRARYADGPAGGLDRAIPELVDAIGASRG